MDFGTIVILALLIVIGYYGYKRYFAKPGAGPDNTP